MTIVIFLMVITYLSPLFQDKFNQNSEDTNFNVLDTSSSVDDFEYSWNASWGGIYDDANSEVSTDSQNNVYLVGYTDPTGSGISDIIISKYDINGQEEWVKTWGGNNDDKAYDIFIDSSDNIFIVGYTKSLGDSNGDLIIIKYDIMGNEIWNKTCGGTQYDRGTKIIEDTLGNYYVSGQTNSFGDVDGDAWLIKFNNFFEEQWNVTWGGSEWDIANSVEIDSNNYIYIAGHSESLDPSPAQSDVFLLKYNSSGDLEWERDWTASYTQRGVGLALDSNDNVYITGYTFGHPASSGKGYLLKYDSSGNFQWERIWGVDGQYGNYFYRIIIDDKDDLYISGCTRTYGIYDNHDALLLNYDTSGNQNWNKIWMGTGYDVTAGICMDSIGNIYLSGTTDTNSVGGYDTVLIKYKNTIGPEITVITPENKTYFEPMSGYYPGTIGFEDIENGLLAPNMDDIPSGSNCQASVVSEKTGHNKVVHIDDDSSITKARLNYNFTDLDYGFVEFWVLAEDATLGIIMQLWDDDTAIDTFRFNLNHDKWNYYINSYWYVIPAFDGIYDPQDNTWYHVTVHFRGNGAPVYQGLDENQYKLIIDGRDSGRINFDNTGTSIERLRFFTGDAATSDLWVDAFGDSSDSDYILGDNLNEGLLLSYENTTNFNWTGYSLDGSSNITIMGDKVIPLPENGIHSLILNGITSEGLVTQSEVRHFSIFFQDPPPPPIIDYPDLIPIFLTSIVLGIIALLSIALFSFRSKIFNRTPSAINSGVKSQVYENVESRREKINFCPICGAPVDNTFQFCSICGASLKDI